MSNFSSLLLVRLGTALLLVIGTSGLLLGQVPDTRLVRAARAGDLVGVQSLLRARVDVNVAEGDGGTALLWAVHQGQTEMVQALLQAGAAADKGNRFGVTPLLEAARIGHAALVQQLLARGANPRNEGPDGETPLMAAAGAGSVDAVKALIAAGAPVNGRERGWGQSALAWAAEEGHTGVVAALLEAGADVNAIAKTSRLSRERAADQGRAWVDHATGGFTPLMFAARAGRLETARALAGRGAALNLATPDGITALLLAVINDRLDVAAMLVDAGASASGGPLYEIVQLHNTRTVETVNDATRARRSNVNAITPLQLAQKMLEKGADPNVAATHTLHIQGTLGGGTGGVAAALNETAFARALRGQDVGMLRLMLAGGANPSTPLATGQLPLVAAMGAGGGARGGGPGGAAAPLRFPGERGADAAVRLLLESGADVNATGPTGDTALHAAAQAGNVAMIQVLADRGASLTATNRAGFTALDVAMGRQPPGGGGAGGARAGAPPGRGGGGGGPQPQAIVLLRQLMGLPPLPPGEMPAAPAAPGGRGF